MLAYGLGLTIWKGFYRIITKFQGGEWNVNMGLDSGDFNNYCYFV